MNAGVSTPVFVMKQFRAYVSRAQEGILSENPSAEGFDRVPSLAEARERAAGETLQESLRAEDMREATHTRGDDCADKACSRHDSSGTDNKDDMKDDMKDESVPLPGGDLNEGAAALKGTLFSRQAILLAIIVNIVLGLVLALVMHLDRPKPPKYVYYIELTDRPDSAGAGMEERAGEQPVLESEAASSQPGEQ